MKRLFTIIAVLMLILFPANASQVMVVSDLHYMAKALYEDSDLFIRALRTGDGKITQYSDELMAALVKEVQRLHPDALIVTGDLTFNGEKASHEALAGWFSKIEALGTPVWVIPGNHDINSATARGFEGDGWYYTDPMTPEMFCDIYADYMLPPEGDANLSYIAPIDDQLSIAMTDVAFYQGGAQSFGIFMASHAAWLENAMLQNKATMITATHHSLIPHTEFSRDTFVMMGSDAMAALMAKYGVKLNLSGHLHIQHIARQGGLTDAATGAFCVWPHRYALVTLDDGKLTYAAEALDEAFLPAGFLDMSKSWFSDIAREKARATLGEDADDGMADYAARFNLAYFSGTYRSDDPSWKDDPSYALWCREKDNVFWQYMKMVMDEPNGDNLFYMIDVA